MRVPGSHVIDGIFWCECAGTVETLPGAVAVSVACSALFWEHRPAVGHASRPRGLQIQRACREPRRVLGCCRSYVGTQGGLELRGTSLNSASC